MNIDATEILVIAHMSLIRDGNTESEDGELFDCVGEANDPMSNFLCEQETKAIIWERFGCSECPDFVPVETI
jgi:hypothetical protein